MKGTCFFTEDVLRTFCLGQHLKNVGPFWGITPFLKKKCRAKFWWQRRLKSTPVISLQTFVQDWSVPGFSSFPRGLREDFFLAGLRMSIRLQNATPENEKVKSFVFCLMLKHLKEKCVWFYWLYIYIYIIFKKNYNHLFKGIFFLPNQKKIDPWNFPFRWCSNSFSTTQKAGVCNNDCIGDT